MYVCACVYVCNAMYVQVSMEAETEHESPGTGDTGSDCEPEWVLGAELRTFARIVRHTLHS